MAVDTNKYKETKICQCICCGKDVTVTKFASAAKVICDECKESDAQPNADIITQVAIKNKKEPRARHDGNTKTCQCIKCGVDVEVTKFASAAKVLCDECKGDSQSGYSAGSGEVNYDIKINMGKLDRKVIPPIEEYIAQPALFANKALREVECPACGHKHMKIIKVLDWSIFGLIVHYQCTSCRLLVSVSEQAKVLLKNFNQCELYDYSGQSIKDLVSGINSSRINTSTMQLMKLCEDNNIEMSGIELPPYVCENDRPVPIGFIIPDGEREIKAVDSAIELLNRLHMANDEQEFKSIKADTMTVIDGLKAIFERKEDDDNG